MPHRYFTTEISDGTATLRGADAHHLARVMRARLGDTVILCDAMPWNTPPPSPALAMSVWSSGWSRAIPAPPNPAWRSLCWPATPSRTSWSRSSSTAWSWAQPTSCPSSAGTAWRPPKKRTQKNERYNRIAAEAAKQCGRGILPDVALPLANFGAVCRTFAQYDLVLFCYECGGAPLRDLLAAAKPADGEKLKIAIVTGAEGGFAAEEAEMAAKAGARTVGLGPRILRCETAPLAVLASVMTLTGNLE